MTKYRYSDDDFITAVKTSLSVREALRKLGQAPHGGSYKTFYLRVKKLSVDISHFTGRGHLTGKSHNWGKKITLSELLIADSDKVLSIKHKQRIIDEGLLKNECSKCGLKDTWQGESIVLHLDHISGDHFDHRIENLRLLCPNCHSQTDTYCARNKKHNEPQVRESIFIPQEGNKCETCGIKLSGNRSKNCGKCYNENRKSLQAPYERSKKIIWPSIEELLLKLETMSYLSLAKELGVSDNAIRKHIKNQYFRHKK